MLAPKGVENLLAAGKCVSTDRAAYLRYVQQTMVTGQAAGVVTALCVKHNKTPRELKTDVSSFRRLCWPRAQSSIFPTEAAQDKSLRMLILARPKKPM